MSKTILVSLLLLMSLPLSHASAQALNVEGGRRIFLDSTQSETTPQYVVYKSAHMTTQAGNSLDANELKWLIGPNSKFSQAIATGNVKAFVNDAANKRTYEVTADTAVYDPKANTIDLTGNVKTVIVSPFTDGPLVQTGTSATVQLGKGPDYPQIVMRQTHTEFNPKQ